MEDYKHQEHYLEDSTLREISQSPKDNYRMASLIRRKWTDQSRTGSGRRHRGLGASECFMGQSVSLAGWKVLETDVGMVAQQCERASCPRAVCQKGLKW